MLKSKNLFLLLLVIQNTVSVFSQNYSWEKGDNDNIGTGYYYGYDTVLAATSPFGRAEAAHWTDKQGRFWIFGGDRTAYSTSPHYLSDMLFFNPDTRLWVLKKGNFLTDNNLGVYGQQGIENAINLPGARRNAATWTDTLGNLWLFGGIGYSETNGANMLNDLWRYNMATNSWTWMKGSKQLMQQGNWGTQGTSSSQNTPGARQGCLTWVDDQGDLWLFGGYGFNSGGNLNQLADLWKYNIASNTWTWVSGNNQNPFGLYSSVGSTGRPGGRADGGCWKDKQGNFWLFGGFGYTDAFGVGYKFLNDVWKYDPVNNVWTWMKGSLYTDKPAVRGTKGVASTNNTPGGRREFGFTADPQGNFWLLGGLQTDGNALTEVYGDLWKYDISNNRWTWMAGSSTDSDLSIFGTLGTPAAANTPGARVNSCGWSDRFGHLWFLGGYGRATTIYFGFMNDVWRYGNCIDGTFTLQATSSPLCKGETATLSIVPTTTVTWSTSQIDSLIAVSPEETTTYSANLADNYGCTLELSIQVDVDVCEGLNEGTHVQNRPQIFPNPGKNTFKLTHLTEANHTLVIYDVCGRVVHQQTIESGSYNLNLNLEPGVYHLIIDQSGAAVKFIIQ